MKLRKQAHTKEIGQNFYQKSATNIKIEKQYSCPGKVFKRGKHKRV